MEKDNSKKNGCTHFHEFMQAELPELKRAIDEDKWYLSENAHHDVGFSTAQKDFLEKYISEWAKNFREKYCNEICPEKDNCSTKNMKG